MPFALLALLFLVTQSKKSSRPRSSFLTRGAASQAQLIAAAKAAGLPVPDFISQLPPQQQLAILNAPATYGTSLALLDPNAAAVVNRIGRLFG
jgi:hypothetical protein